MVTLRRTDAINFLRRIMEAKKNVIKSTSFDNNGNLSLGIHDHIDIPGTKYNPDIGIFGMDIWYIFDKAWLSGLKEKKSFKNR